MSAFGLKAMRLLIPDRHARLFDASMGGFFGIGIAQLAQMFLHNQLKRAG